MKYFALLLLSFCTFTMFAQSRDTIFYYADSNRNPVDKDKAINIFKIYQVDSGWVLTTSDGKNSLLQLETYTDSLLKVLSGPYLEYVRGKVSLSGAFKKNKREGVFKTFDMNGNLTKTAIYHLDSIRGKTFEYYPNGNIKEEKLYEKSLWPVSKIAYREDGGKEETTYDEKGHKLTAMQYYPNGKLGINERFNENGKTVEATYFDVDGKATKPYTMETPPSFPGGMVSFENYLRRHIVYPEDAVGNNIKGHAYLHFTITETGNLEDIRISQDLSPSFDKEALIRTIRQSPKWNPGKRYGKPVSVKFNMPINFIEKW